MNNMTRKTWIPAALAFTAILAGCQHTQPAQRNAAAQEAAAQQAAAPAAGVARQQATVDFRLAQTQAGKGLAELKLAQGSLWVLGQPVLTRSDLASIEPRHTQDGRPYLRFGFSREGARKLAALSQRYTGKLLVVTVDNALIAVPRIEGTVSSGIFNVPVQSDRQALELASRIAGPAKAN